jgi:adenylate cyclase
VAAQYDNQASDVALQEPSPQRDSAVLFADVIGSAALYERLHDEETAGAVLACFKALHTATEAHGGRVVKNIGDGIMALFPSAGRAAEAATRMHLAASALPAIAGHKIALRIGFHAGPVVPRGGDIFGDTVNVAARLVAQATKGQVLTSAETVKKLPPLVRSSTRQLYDIAVKGKAAEVSLCELLWSKSADVTDFPLAQSTKSARRSELRLKLGDREIICRLEDAITIGRDPGSTFVVEETTASRRHCTIERRQQNFIVRDHSSNGTFVSFGRRGDEMLLQREDVVLQGHGWLTFGEPKSTATYVLEFEELKGETDGPRTE